MKEVTNVPNASKLPFKLSGGKLAGLNIVFLLMVGLILTALLILAFFPNAEQEAASQTAASGSDAGAGVGAGPESEAAVMESAASGAVLPPGKGRGERGANSDIFADLRFEREKSRSRTQELFEEISDDPDSASDLKNAAQQELWRLTRLIALEDELEGILRARGYLQVIVLLQDRNATVLVGQNSLKDAEVADIAGIIARISGISSEGIRIYEKRLSD